MPDSSPFQAGQKVGAGRFTLIKPLGRGGMGEVWLAQDERLEEPVALKFLPPEVRADPVALHDLRRETARSHKLTHPKIVRIHDLHEEPGGMAFIAMEYVDGPTLAGLRLQQPERVLRWEFLRPLVQQLCAALDYAHGEKVIHRDLKPANVMVDGKGRLKLSDFGIAATVSDSVSRVSGRHATSGTLPYMSPQQLAGKRPQAADDIYALGATLYELLTSQPPFYTGDITHQVLHEPPEPPQERLAALGIQNEIPPDVAAIVMACLAKEPAQRPQSARAVAEWVGLEVVSKPSLQSLASEVFGEAEPAPVAAEQAEVEAAAEAPHTMGHRRKLLWLGGAVTAAVVLVLGGVWLLTRVASKQIPISFYRAMGMSTNTPLDTNAPNGMALIPAGSFMMGDTFGEGDGFDLSLHTVQVSAFYMDKTEVTKGLWNEVMTWAAAHGYSFNNTGSGKAPNHPVHTVDWWDAVKWCNARSEKDGRVPAYYTSAAQTTVYRTGQIGVENEWVNWNSGYRLPTEAEWEKAARGGASGHRFPWSNVDTITHDHANYLSDSNYLYDISSTRGLHPTYDRDPMPYTSPAGSFAPNAYGLYDMAGNLLEWCWDWYGSYSSSSQNDPHGAASGSYRVGRGGDWGRNASGCRVSRRFYLLPDGEYSVIGFRSALPAGQ